MSHRKQPKQSPKLIALTLIVGIATAVLAFGASVFAQQKSTSGAGTGTVAPSSNLLKSDGSSKAKIGDIKGVTVKGEIKGENKPQIKESSKSAGCKTQPTAVGCATGAH